MREDLLRRLRRRGWHFLITRKGLEPRIIGGQACLMASNPENPGFEPYSLALLKQEALRLPGPDVA